MPGQVDDTEIDAAANRKLRGRTSSEKKKPKKETKPLNEDEMPVFWKTGGKYLVGEDKHFAKGKTDPANVKIAKNNTEFNKHVLFRIDSNFQLIRAVRFRNRYFNQSIQYIFSLKSL
jgi:hypothetical protein